jgi:hypothetical protein
MLKVAISLMLATAIMGSPVWAQSASAPSAQSHDDAIVQMRQEIATARKEYKRKVGEAKKVYDEQKSAAAKERDTAIAAARTAAGQK